MNLDEQLQSAWEAETGEPETLESLTGKVRRQRRWRRLRRAMEIGLTLAAIAIFAQALLSQTMRPAHWVLLPFFLVFLPMVWTLALRGPRSDSTVVTASISAYARVRLAQLRNGLRELVIAKRTAQLLLVYSIAVNVMTWWLGDSEWQQAGLVLLVHAVAWLGATFLLAQRLGRRREAECHNLRSLLEG